METKDSDTNNDIDGLLDNFGAVDDEPDNPSSDSVEAKSESAKPETEEKDWDAVDGVQEESGETSETTAEDPSSASSGAKEQTKPPSKSSDKGGAFKKTTMGRKKNEEGGEEDEVFTYVVQRGFSVEGRTYHRGDTIPVKCKYCALWQKEWAGKVRCAPGRAFEDGDVMRADKWSCGSFFIAKEMEPELNNFLAMDPMEVATVRRMLPGMRKLLECEPWLNTQIEKKKLDQDPSMVFENAKGFIMSFTTVEQLQHAEHFIRSYASLMLRKQKDRKPKKIKFDPGDWVEWLDSQSGTMQKGIVMKRGRGIITIAGVEGEMAGVTMTFKEKDWKKTSEPKIIKKAIESDQSE